MIFFNNSKSLQMYFFLVYITILQPAAKISIQSERSASILRLHVFFLYIISIFFYSFLQ